jgi:hypothetical protein
MRAALSSELEQLIRSKLEDTEFRSREELTESIAQMLASYDIMATPAQVRQLIEELGPGTQQKAG